MNISDKKEIPQTEKPTVFKNQFAASTKPHYACYVDGKWDVEMLGTKDKVGAGRTYAGIFGHPIQGITIEGVKKYRVCTAAGGWTDYTEGFDKTSPIGDGSNIIGIEIVDPKAMAAVHIKGGMWLEPVNTSATDGAVVIGCNAPIDAIWIDR